MDRMNKFPWWKREGFGSPFLFIASAFCPRIASFLKRKDRKRPLRFLSFGNIFKVAVSEKLIWCIIFLDWIIPEIPIQWNLNNLTKEK